MNTKFLSSSSLMFGNDRTTITTKRPQSLQVSGDWEDGGTLKDTVKSGDRTDLWGKIIQFRGQ